MRRILLISMAALLAAGPARGQGTSLDTSVRAAGMGGVSNAVVWGVPNAWSNPALLGLVEGVGYEYGRTQLLPGLTDDVFLTSRRVFIGSSGIGLAFTGWPQDLGGIKLDYGSLESFPVYNDIDAFSFGLSGSGMLSAAWRMAGSAPPAWIDRIDGGWGATRKHVTGQFFPGVVGTADDEDQGWFARITPVLVPREGHEPLRLDVAYGHSDINRHQSPIDFGFGPEPLQNITRDGGALRLVVPKSPWRDDAESWLAKGFQPFLVIGGGWDHERGETRFDLDVMHYDVDRYGAEITFANVFTGRVGYVDDPDGQIQDTSFGAGVNLPLGRVLSVRYDYADIPQANDLERVQRHSVTAFVNLVELARAVSSGTDDSHRESSSGLRYKPARK